MWFERQARLRNTLLLAKESDRVGEGFLRWSGHLSAVTYTSDETNDIIHG